MNNRINPHPFFTAEGAENAKKIKTKKAASGQRDAGSDQLASFSAPPQKDLCITRRCEEFFGKLRTGSDEAVILFLSFRAP